MLCIIDNKWLYSQSVQSVSVVSWHMLKFARKRSQCEREYWNKKLRKVGKWISEFPENDVWKISK